MSGSEESSSLAAVIGRLRSGEELSDGERAWLKVVLTGMNQDLGVSWARIGAAQRKDGKTAKAEAKRLRDEVRRAQVAGES